MRLGQPVQLFHAAAQADTKNLATTNSNQRMRELVALAQCVVLGPGVEVSKNTRPPVVVKSNHQRKRPQQNAGDQKEHAGVDAAQKQDAHGDDRNDHKGAHVGFGQQQAAHDAHGGGHGPHGANEVLFEFNLAHHIACGVQHG